MKVIFGGPTLRGMDLPADAGLVLRAPARQGDFYRAVQDGANVIGIVDGVYEYVPAIWHKEILYGLSKGVRVFGAASMGALRAAECAAFGMIGLGRIYEDFVSGVLEDDADVAQAHGPSELGFLPLSEPLVNVRATLAHCLDAQLISASEHRELMNAAASIFFKERTYKRIVAAARDIAPHRAAEIYSIVKTNALDQKLSDAKLLVSAVIEAPDRRSVAPSGWRFERTALWDNIFPA